MRDGIGVDVTDQTPDRVLGRHGTGTEIDQVTLGGAFLVYRPLEKEERSEFWFISSTSTARLAKQFGQTPHEWPQQSIGTR